MYQIDIYTMMSANTKTTASKEKKVEKRAEKKVNAGELVETAIKSVDLKKLRKLMKKEISRSSDEKLAKEFRDELLDSWNDLRGDSIDKLELDSLNDLIRMQIHSSSEYPRWMDPGCSSFMNIIDEIIDDDLINKFRKVFGLPMTKEKSFRFAESDDDSEDE